MHTLQKNELGDNALYHISALLEKLKKLELPQEGILGQSSLTPTAIQSFPNSRNVVPGEARLIIDYRNVPSDDTDSILNRLEQLAPDIEFRLESNEYKSANGKVHMKDARARDGFLSPGENKFIQQARESFQATLNTYNRDFAEDCWWFATDAPLLAASKTKSGSDCIVFGFGPGEEELAHTTNESISIEDLKIAREAYKNLLMAYSN